MWSFAQRFMVMKENLKDHFNGFSKKSQAATCCIHCDHTNFLSLCIRETRSGTWRVGELSWATSFENHFTNTQQAASKNNARRTRTTATNHGILQDSHMCGKLIAHCSSSILGNLASSLPRSHTLNRDHMQPRRQNGTKFGWSSVRRQKIAKLYSCTWFHLRRCLQTKHNCLERSDKTLTWLMDMVFCWRLYAYSTKPEFRRQKSL